MFCVLFVTRIHSHGVVTCNVAKKEMTNNFTVGLGTFSSEDEIFLSKTQEKNCLILLYVNTPCNTILYAYTTCY